MKKWRNKITGEINEFMVHKRIEDSEDGNPVYAPFDGNIDEWEDYEEQKKYYYITSCGEITHRGYRLWENESVYDKKRKEIGNYFETEAEAEEAAGKLKAWQRLRDKGFRFEGWDNTDHSTIHNFSLFVVIEDLDNINKDLDLLFGGEE